MDVRGWGEWGREGGSSRSLLLAVRLCPAVHSRSTQGASCRYPSERGRHDHLPTYFCWLRVALGGGSFLNRWYPLGHRLSSVLMRENPGAECRRCEQKLITKVGRTENKKLALVEPSKLSASRTSAPISTKFMQLEFPFSHPWMPSFSIEIPLTL